MRIPVIALKGKGGSGKTTAARYILGKGYVKTSFATPLRAMLTAIGLSEAELSGELKELPSATLDGATPRAAMQLLGTEWGRALSPELWTGMWRRHARDILLQDGFGVVVDDCRFPNEAAVVRSMGGFVIEIIDPNAAESEVGISGHASEAQDFDPDITVLNDKSSLAALHASIDEAISVLMSGYALDLAA